MQLNSLFYFFWGIKRNIWQIGLTVALITSLVVTSFTIQATFAALLVFRLGLDLWNYLSFKPFDLGAANNQPRIWQNILAEFQGRNQSLAFKGVTRQQIADTITNAVNNEKITQGANNLCGPIALLKFLATRNKPLFVKTMCEYYENGCTQSPFYLQSSFWDRWKNVLPEAIFRKIFGDRYINHAEAVAGAFKNTHNLLGYNHACFLESFCGSTEPKRILQWLEQAGYQAKSNIVMKNYRNNGEMPLFFRAILGGMYGFDNQQQPNLEENINEANQFDYINLSQTSGGSALHFMFNVASGHWEHKKDVAGNTNHIKIHLRPN